MLLVVSIGAVAMEEDMSFEVSVKVDIMLKSILHSTATFLCNI